MRLRILLAAALCAGSATFAGPAMAQDDVLVAIHTDDAIHFVSQDVLDELGRVGQAAIMPVPEARLWLTVERFDVPAGQPWSLPRQRRATKATVEYGDFVDTPAGLPNRCTDSGQLCAGAVRAYRSSLDSWRWQANDPIEGRNTRVLGVSFTMTIA